MATPSPGPGWVQYGDGGWVPPDHPLALQQQQQQPAPTAPAPTAPTAPAPTGAPGPDWVQYGDGGWAPPNHPIAQQPAPAPGAGPAAPPPPAGTPAPGTTPTPGPTTPQGAPLATNAAQISSPFYQTLHGILSQQNPVTQNDEQVKNALNAARSEEERNFARQRGEMAERAAAQGTSMSGGFDAMLANARSGIGARQGQLASDLVRQQQTDRMAQIMSALSIGQGIMSDSDRNILQRELAQLDAALRREGLGVQAGEGAAERALRQALQTEQIGFQGQEGAAERRLREALSGDQLGFNYAQLGQQGEQFGQSLAAQVGTEEARLAQALIIALMGGGG